MTVGDLKKFLSQYDEDTRVVVKDTDKKSCCLDFVGLKTEDAGLVNASPLKNQGSSNRSVFEAKSSGDVQILALNCKPKIY